jgi:hypothetical protein
MSSITVFEQIQKELRVDADGVGYCSIRGAARLAGVAHTGLVQGFQNDGKLLASKLAEMLSDEGFWGGKLESFAIHGIPDTALSVILEYYAFEAGRYCTDIAKAAYRAFARVGIRATIQDVCGFRKESERTVPNNTQQGHNLTNSEVLRTYRLILNAKERNDWKMVNALESMLGIELSEPPNATMSVDDAIDQFLDMNGYIFTGDITDEINADIFTPELLKHINKYAKKRFRTLDSALLLFKAYLKKHKPSDYDKLLQGSQQTNLAVMNNIVIRGLSVF